MPTLVSLLLWDPRGTHSLHAEVPGNQHVSAVDTSHHAQMEEMLMDAHQSYQECKKIYEQRGSETSPCNALCSV